MLMNKSRQAKSLSCLNLQRQKDKGRSPAERIRNSDSQFVPFTQERRLGKLITKQTQPDSARSPTNEQLIERINFRNFGSIYKLVSRVENQKYSQMTRASGQKNLINLQWKLNNLSNLPQHSRKSIQPRFLPPTTQQPQRSVPKFEKMNQYLFKKLSRVPKPVDNPELQQLYSNYIKVSELNQNIKRQQLTGKIKLNPFS